MLLPVLLTLLPVLLTLRPVNPPSSPVNPPSCPVNPPSCPVNPPPCAPAQAPKLLKVFINLPRSMSFDDAERSEPTQALDLTEDDFKDDGLVPLRYVKFQNVQSVTVMRLRPVSGYKDLNQLVVMKASTS